MIKTFIAASLFLFSTNLFAQKVSAPLSDKYKSMAETEQQAVNERQHAKGEESQELGEDASIRLQQEQDRRSKLSEKLSNIMKKNAETEEGIINNIQ
ncbi:MAG: hypothetical protein NVSMB40_15670 [Aquirhabdus sp.]